jgi:glycosyltransferase involved in cell wall biosynthesis
MKAEPTDEITFFLPSLVGGGAEKAIITLANAFVERNLQVTLIVGIADGILKPTVDKRVRIVNLGCERVIKCILPLARFLIAKRPKFLLSAMNHANIAVVLAAKLSGRRTKIVVCEHANYSLLIASKGKIKAVILNAITKIAYLQADKIVAVSEGAANSLCSLIKIDRSRIEVIYNPACPSSEQLNNIKNVSHQFFDKKNFIIIAAGRLSPEKDFETLIRAFAIVKYKIPCKLIIIGEGPERDSLGNLIIDLNLSSDVLLPGFVNNPLDWISCSSLFVLSSLSEAFGNVLVEAMACGIPVVSTSCNSGPEEILENGKWGRLVPPQNAEALSQAIYDGLTCSRSPDVILRAQSFSIARSVARYLEVVNQIG